MPNTLRGLSIYQWGAESVAGTAVAATSKILVEEATFEEEDAVYRPRTISGRLIRSTGNEFVITRGTRFTLRGPCSYAQMIQLLEMTHQGAVTPSGGPTYTWTFTRAPTSVPVYDTFTLERRLNDGSNSIDNEWAFCTATSLKISGGPREVLSYELQGFARRVQASTLTNSLSLPTTELIPHGTSRLYIDTSWAGLGGTQVSSQLLEWSLTYNTGLEPLFTADGRSDLDFPVVAINDENVGLEFTARLLIPGSSSQYATEKTAAEAQSLRAVQLRTVGTSPNDLKLNFLAKHERGSVFNVGTMNGQQVVDLSMREATDGTNMWSAILINQVATDA